MQDNNSNNNSRNINIELLEESIVEYMSGFNKVEFMEFEEEVIEMVKWYMSEYKE